MCASYSFVVKIWNLFLLHFWNWLRVSKYRYLCVCVSVGYNSACLPLKNSIQYTQWAWLLRVFYSVISFFNHQNMRVWPLTRKEEIFFGCRTRTRIKGKQTCQQKSVCLNAQFVYSEQKGKQNRHSSLMAVDCVMPIRWIFVAYGSHRFHQLPFLCCESGGGGGVGDEYDEGDSVQPKAKIPQMLLP